jgi:hypothetical protein
MLKRNSWVAIGALVVCGLVFAGSLGYNILLQGKDKIVTPTTEEINNVDNTKPGIFANVSGEDLAKIDVRRGFAVVDNTVYFVRNKSEAEIRAEITKQKPQTDTANDPKTQTSTTTPEIVTQAQIDANAFAASQLMSWSSEKGVNLVTDLSNVDAHPINRLSSFVEKNSLFLFPCIPGSDPLVTCETSKIYQFDLTNNKLALISDISTTNDKENQIKTLNQKYHFDDLSQPYWQDIRGGTVYGIKNVFNTENGGKNLTGYLMSTKDGLTEKAIVIGSQLAKADLKVNNKGYILIDQSGTLKTSGTCLIEHRIIEINPDRPSEQKKAVVKKLNLDEKGAWNDGTTRTDEEQKAWSATCQALPDYSDKTPEQLLQINIDAEAQKLSFE